MQTIVRCLIAAAFLGGAMPASAHFHHRPPAPRCWPAGPGLVVKGSNYQQWDGSYASLADLTRSVNGTPCGGRLPGAITGLFRQRAAALLRTLLRDQSE